VAFHFPELRLPRLLSHRLESFDMSSLRKSSLIIIFIGFGLRAYRLGSNSLWNDEVGVALVALLPNLESMINGIQAHAMAMPLDYLIIHAIIKTSLREFVLRLPAAFFGTLTLAIYYRLSRRLVEEKAALLAVLLLALSPLHIMYSQEMRFYASLVFFFYLAVDLFIKAAKKSVLLDWIFLVLISGIGIYFHIYVSLWIIYGVVWIIMNKKIQQVGKSFVLTCLFVIIFAVIGYLYFGAHQKFNYPLLPWGGTLFREIALGLGWQELPFTPLPNIGRSWYIVCFVFFLLGLMTTLKSGNKSVIALIISCLIQILLIVISDLLKGYWFAYRQILYLHPAMLMVSSVGLLTAMDILKRCRKLIIIKITSYGLITVSLLLSFLALANYYQWPKSDARWISEYLSRNWEAGEIILVVPGYQEKVYRYYLQYVYSRPDIVSWVYPSEAEDIIKLKLNAEAGFLIVVGDASSNEEWIAKLLKMGLRPVKIPRSKWLGQYLFVWKHK
jgi:uncharacterized membrane protein